MSEIITIKNLNKSYGAFKVIDNLNLAVKPGEFFGFLGPNGAGKTTTIRLLTGIIKVDSGSITIDGLTEDHRSKISGLIGAVPESHGLYDWMTATEYLNFFASLYHLPLFEVKTRVSDLLIQVDLKKQANKKIGNYSRGMRQRLGLARALINNPKIIILDEPTLGLDPQGQIDIQAILKNLNEKGVTIFYSSHLLSEVTALCTRVAIINQGHLAAIGTVPELLAETNSRNLTDVFLNLTTNKND